MIFYLISYFQPLQGDFLTSKIFSDNIRFYFDVDNRYVLNKLRIITFPFFLKKNEDLIDLSSTYNNAK